MTAVPQNQQQDPTVTITATITTPATVPSAITPVASSPESSDSVAVATCKEEFVPVSAPYIYPTRACAKRG